MEKNLKLTEAPNVIPIYTPAENTILINDLRPWNEFYEEGKMTLKEFIDEVKIGFLTDDDGYGYYATEEGLTDIKVYPSHVTYNWLKNEYPYVCWFNK